MKIYFEYPYATEENLKAVQDAINEGKDIFDMNEMFGETLVWDCIVVLSGNKDTPWALLDNQCGNEQTKAEVWQIEIEEDYIRKCQILQPNFDDDELAIKIDDRILLIESYGEGGWDHYLLNRDGEVIDAGGVLGDENMPLGEAVRELLDKYQMPIDGEWSFPCFRPLWEKALG